MTDFPNRTSEQLEKDLLNQAEKSLRECLKMDETLRSLLKSSWKDMKLVGEINDSIHLNNQTIENLKNEIQDRNSRITKK